MALSGGLSGTGDAVCRAIGELDPGPLLIALSGGADSAVAAWAAATARPPGSVVAIHIDHGWAGSAELRKSAAAIAEHLGLPLEFITVTPQAIASPEGAAREARLAALAEAAQGRQVVLGHHADDAVETVVGNLLRGAGLTGLSGISAHRSPFVRPLLEFRGAALRRLAEELELPFRDDPSNQDVALRRNLLRRKILPELDRHIDGELADIIGRSAAHLAAADAYIEDAAPEMVVKRDGEALVVATAPLVTAPPVLAQAAVRGLLRTVHPPYPGTSREVGDVLAVAEGRHRRRELSGGIVVAREGPQLAFYSAKEPVSDVEVKLPVPGEAVCGRHRISAVAADSSDKGHMAHDRCRVFVPVQGLTVRAVRQGDAIDIGDGTKAVFDALNEAAVPVRKRSAWPVVASRGTIVWVAGVRVAAWARTEASPGAWIELERRNS